MKMYAQDILKKVDSILSNSAGVYQFPEIMKINENFKKNISSLNAEVKKNLLNKKPDEIAS